MAYTSITPKESAQRIARLPQVRRWREGNYEPGSWFTDPVGNGGSWGSWGRKLQPTRRGITFVDMNRADPRPIPEEGPGLVVDRGGGAEPASQRYEYQLNKKYQVWADNLETLYEEAMSRQWSATKDIPWDKLEPMPQDQERALCQFMSFLHTVEFVPTDTLPYYMARIDPAFPEPRQFLATQCVDEARHMEVFAKRIFANGGGPGVEPGAEAVLQADPAKSALPPEIAMSISRIGPEWDFLAYSYYVQMMGEAVVLDLFRFGEFLGRNPCDKEIFRRVMQDEARHVSFGTMRMRYYLEHAPKDERKRALEMVHYLASISEAGATGFSLLINPNVIEPFALLAAGSLANIEQGWEWVREFWARVVQEYLDRCERAGFPRADRCLLPKEAPF
ncbi:MAG: ferritin-like domain-containing protein [Dehalococcoidia bacterium]